MLLQESFENHIICHLALLCQSSSVYQVTTSYPRKYEPDLTLYTTMTVTIAFISFEYNFLGLKYEVTEYLAS